MITPAEISRRVLATLAPPPKYTVSQWADARRKLSAEASAIPGSWRTKVVEYMREPMDCVGDPRVTRVVVMAAAQVAKPLAVCTPIATPVGWTTMGELCVGDEVFGSDGCPTIVTGVSDVKYGRDCYDVDFCDGTSITCDAEHLWYVESDTVIGPCNNLPGKGPRSGVLRTDVIRDTLKYGKNCNRNRYAIPVTKPLVLPPIVLPIDPYVLGAWLGDGHSASSRLFCHTEDADHFISEFEKVGHRTRLEHDGCAIVRIDPKDRNICPRGHDKNVLGWNGAGCAECGRIASKNNLRKKRGLAQEKRSPIVMTLPRLLASTGLLNNKHVPKIYLRASMSQRLALLQGMMDTDGCVVKSGKSSFVTTSTQIRDGFADLLSGMGIRYGLSDCIPTTIYLGKRVSGKRAYKFTFTVHDTLPVFRLPRKLSRLVSPRQGRPSDISRRRIVGVTPVETTPVKCIQVAAENHLFLAGRQMVPTHNTEILLNVIGYSIDYDPSPIMVVQPTLDMAQTFSKDRVAPMLRDTPALRRSVKDVKSRDSSNTIMQKQFPGGHLTMVGANSPSSLASRPIRVVLCDEVDRFPVSAGTEGDPIALAVKRTATFWNRIVVFVSTPTNKDASRIEAAYNEGDMRQRWCPCHGCGEYNVLKWSQVRWDEGKPDSAHYVCESCGSIWTDAQRIASVRKGEWRASAPFTGVASFHVTGLLSPFATMVDGVREFLEARNDPARLRVWVNTYLGETWEDEGVRLDPHELYQRREEYESRVPDGVTLLTAGIDVQDDRIEAEIVGWGDNYESWSVDYVTLYGDPSAPDIWSELTRFLRQVYIHPLFGDMTLRASCIDTGGHYTQQTYKYTQSQQRVYAIKGIAGEGKPIVGRPSRSNIGKIPLFPVGVHTAKELVYARVRVKEGDAGYCHFPMDRDEEYFHQFTAEKLVTRYHKGFKRTEYVKTRSRNEALDNRVYATAALEMLNVDLGAQRRAMEMRLQRDDEEKPSDNKRTVRKPSTFVNRWRDY